MGSPYVESRLPEILIVLQQGMLNRMDTKSIGAVVGSHARFQMSRPSNLDAAGRVLEGGIGFCRGTHR
jgi:hypothetical protein